MNAEVLNNEGVQLFLNGHFINAKKKYKEALNKDPNHTTTLNNLGMLSLQEKNYDQAIAYFKKAIEKKESITYRLNLGHAFANKNNFIEAEAQYKLSIALDKNSLNAWKSLASLYQLQKKNHESIQIWQQLLINIPEEPNISFQLAKDYMAIQKYQNALFLLEQTIFLETQKAEVGYCIASIHFHNQNFGYAEMAIKKSLVNNPDKKEYRTMLATILLAQSKLDEAIVQWDFILQLDKQYHKARIDKAVALLAHGYKKQALQEIKEVLKSDENHPKALFYKAIVLIELQGKNKEKGIKILETLEKESNKYAVNARELLNKITS